MSDREIIEQKLQHYQELLAIHEGRLKIIQTQIHTFGVGFAPSHLIYERDIEQAQIYRYRKAIDHPEAYLEPLDINNIHNYVYAPLITVLYKNNQTISRIVTKLQYYGISIRTEYDIPVIMPRSRYFQASSINAQGAVIFITKDIIEERIGDIFQLYTIIQNNNHQFNWMMIVLEQGFDIYELQSSIDRLNLHLPLSNVSLVQLHEIESLKTQNDFIHRLVRDTLSPFLKQVHFEQYVGLDTYQIGLPGYNTPAMLSCNWGALLEDNSQDESNWNELKSVLKHLRENLEFHNCRRLAIRPRNLRLSAALLFGFAFRTTSNFYLRVLMISNPQKPDQGEWWEYKRVSAESPLFNVQPQAFDLVGNDVVLNIGIATSVRATTHGLQLPIAQQVDMTLKAGAGGTSVQSNEQANQIIYEIMQVITDLRTQGDCGTIHLFIAAPVALLILLGTQLNRCGPIQMYEYDQSEGGNIYIPSCRLTV